MAIRESAKFILVAVLVGLIALALFGVGYVIVAGAGQNSVGLGWYIFSFVMGLTMIVLPCTLPLAFVIVPLSMGKGPLKGLGVALAFGLGVSLMLSVYGIAAAFLGKVAIGSLGAPLELVKNWLYFGAGIFAYLFALGEIGLINFHMPTYRGAAPAFIQKQQDFIKAFLLGLFLGNVGVGCPHPATPLILGRIAVSGNVFYGWTLFLTHAIGRVIPLLILAVLAILGTNALSWLVSRKEKIEKATGWMMVLVAAFILILGLFTHDWWVFSGQHTLLESITQEEGFLGFLIKQFNLGGIPHTHGIPTGTGLFGQPLWLGNWALVLLWVWPFFWYYQKKKAQAEKLPPEEQKIETRVRPLRLWFLITLSLLLAVLFINVLPQRFLNQAMTHTHEESMTDTHTGAMTSNGSGHTHNPTAYHDALATTDGPVSIMKVLAGTGCAACEATSSLRVGEPAELGFFVSQKPANSPIPISQLEYNHGKLMHVIGVRSDMAEFFHIHPAAAATTTGLMTITHTFLKPGRYKIWSEIQQDGVDHVFGEPVIEVRGAGPTDEKNVNLSRTVLVADSDGRTYQVGMLGIDPFVKNISTTLQIEVHTVAGADVELENYLTVPMHLTMIKDDWSQFVHTHPDSYGHTVNFTATFPESGLYRVFAQFRPTGIHLPPDEALAAVFWVRVVDKPTLPISPWWLNLIGSLILIVALARAVKRYLEPKRIKPDKVHE
ncbi:MAG: hypothetical protein HY220_04065 [Candidatus Sungbacteria bacterium]|uniref:Cytochrome C biogenesis protein transmembrane domain-containing protein n=1 Tax=Candidatus Sungiibacteriota bacterium TaxID=2750080 RepID=A0A9D6LNU9_9BACT|nr:hypothetical protein [Candidatus Sungbacteria bacterium]